MPVNYNNDLNPRAKSRKASLRSRGAFRRRAVQQATGVLGAIFKYLLLPWLFSQVGIVWYYQIMLFISLSLLRFVKRVVNPPRMLAKIFHLYSSPPVSSSDDHVEYQILLQHKKNQRLTLMQRLHLVYYKYMARVKLFTHLAEEWHDFNELNRENLQKLGCLSLNAEYIFDRYLLHSPVCVINKLPGLTTEAKPSYTFGGIQLTKKDGFQDYLRLKQELAYRLNPNELLNLGKSESPPQLFSPAVQEARRINSNFVELHVQNGNKTHKLRLKVTPKPSKFIRSIGVNETNYINLVSNEIKSILPQSNYDDGSLAPIVLRLAWHCCATYDVQTKTGGSNGATMRFIPEITDEGNTGLEIARNALEPIKQNYPRISYSDLWTLAGKIALESMGCPTIPWKCGRVDCLTSDKVPPNGRLPFGDKAASHIRSTFGRMGFNDQEMVLLLGAHGLGRCHKKYSGWDGKWTQDPIKFDNQFYKVLLEEDWQLGIVPETGRSQYYNGDKSLMMLNTDLELIRDEQFAKWVRVYAYNQSLFFKDFCIVFGKLLELGIERDSGENVLLPT